MQEFSVGDGMLIAVGVGGGVIEVRMRVCVFVEYGRGESEAVYCDLDVEEYNGSVRNSERDIKRGVERLDEGMKGV